MWIWVTWPGWLRDSLVLTWQKFARGWVQQSQCLTCCQMLLGFSVCLSLYSACQWTPEKNYMYGCFGHLFHKILHEFWLWLCEHTASAEPCKEHDMLVVRDFSLDFTDEHCSCQSRYQSLLEYCLSVATNMVSVEAFTTFLFWLTLY